MMSNGEQMLYESLSYIRARPHNLLPEATTYGSRLLRITIHAPYFDNSFTLIHRLAALIDRHSIDSVMAGTHGSRRIGAGRPAGSKNHNGHGAGRPNRRQNRSREVQLQATSSGNLACLSMDGRHAYHSLRFPNRVSKSSYRQSRRESRCRLQCGQDPDDIIQSIQSTTTIPITLKYRRYLNAAEITC